LVRCRFAAGEGPAGDGAPAASSCYPPQRHVHVFVVGITLLLLPPALKAGTTHQC
jgi:hypothetical protein